jgi:hypothetical protein
MPLQLRRRGRIAPWLGRHRSAPPAGKPDAGFVEDVNLIRRVLTAGTCLDYVLHDEGETDLCA